MYTIHTFPLQCRTKAQHREEKHRQTFCCVGKVQGGMWYLLDHESHVTETDNDKHCVIREQVSYPYFYIFSYNFSKVSNIRHISLS